MSEENEGLFDDVLRMAQEAGWKDLREFDSEMQEDFFVGRPQDLERFAALVAAQEREACAEVCEQEVCACCWSDDAQAAAEHLSERIRARGQA
jgi:hypothetical protein